MCRPTLPLILLVAALAARAAPARAHHSFTAEYDANAAVSLDGVVTRIEWTNPHAYLYVDVPGAGGTVVRWTFECYPPEKLASAGLPRTLLKAGDAVHVTGYRARFMANRAAGHQITLADGRTFALGPKA